MTLTRLIGSFVRRHWRAYVASALMLVGVALLTVWIPRQVGAVIDGLVAGRLTGTGVLREVLLIAAMGGAIYFLRVGWRLRLFAAAYRLGVELRTRLYERFTLQGLPFFQKQRTGDLMARATNDVDAVEMAAGEAFLAAFDGTLTLVLVVAMMTLGIDWRLGLVALLPFPLMAWAFWIISRRVHDAWALSLERFSSLNEHVQETVAGVRTLRALGLEARAERDFAQRTQAAADAGFTAQKWESAYEPAVGLTLSAASVLTLTVGGWLVSQRELTVGQLTAFTMYLGQLIWPMFAAGWVLSLIERGKAAWERLEPVLGAPLSVDDHGTVTAAPAGTLRFERVSFTYPSVRSSDEADGVRAERAPERADTAFGFASVQSVADDAVARSDGPAGGPLPALVDVSFELPAGRTLGIVGPTGAGKTTLLALLLRHYAPAQGELRWGSHRLDDYRLAALRGAIAWVPQEAFLFSASIADNIALARPQSTRGEIEHAAKLAALHDDVLRFPQGYDTQVGEKGVTLSGGQRQRVAIARALLAQTEEPAAAPPLLLLDDALSAVDTGTETKILAHLRGTLAGGGAARRTAIIVSHRLSAVVDADQILVLKQGRVVERGTHDQLLALDGWYAAQWRYQQLEASLERDAGKAVQP